MAVYGDVKVKTFIHAAGDPPADQTAAVGTLPKDMNDYIVTLDSGDEPIISINQVVVDRQVITTVVSGK